MNIFFFYKKKEKENININNTPTTFISRNQANSSNHQYLLDLSHFKRTTAKKDFSLVFTLIY